MKRKGKGGLLVKNKCGDKLKTEDVAEANENGFTNGGESMGRRKMPRRDAACSDKLENGKNIEATENGTKNGDESMAPRKMPRRAAACSDFKQKSVRLVDKKAVIQNKQDGHVEEEESEAVRLTMLGPEQRPCRKIIDFILHDSDGNSQPFEMSEIDDTYITALVTPMDEDLVSAREKGVKCEGFGRIESWSISGYDDCTPVIWVITDVADYECVKPASTYKKFFDRFQEKTNVCVEVYKKLAKSQGGDPNLSLEELLARVVRAMSGNRSFPVGSSGLEYVISLGEFIFNQLVGLDVDPGSGDAKFSTLPVLISLKEHCQNRAKIDKNLTTGASKTLRIGDGKKMEDTEDEDEDEKLARLLQEEEEWKVMKQRSRQAPSSNKFYIKITEDEIANDYPLPAYYKPVVQETDEYVFFDSDDAVCYSDALPTRILDNWSLYNSDSRLISLELLPMKPCAEVDVTIFGSGYMREDDGTGFCLDVDVCQSSSSSGAATDGIPVYLSAIKEWMIEFGSSMVFISVRTEMAWYRLGKPAKQYAPWYEPILKTARLAIGIISLLKEQSRASKISFTDAIKKVAEFEKSNPAYISSNIAAVERYVVVHGQIILQQFAEYPDEVIRRCAFVTGLSEKMESRHHIKLLLRKKVSIQKEANMNPSASMEPIQSKRKVMRATTTRLINRIWGEYYSNYMPEESKEGSILDQKEEEDVEEQEENDDEDDLDEVKVLCNEENPKPQRVTRSQRVKTNENGIGWQGASSGNTSAGEPIYKSATVRGNLVSVGGAVIVDSDELEDGDVVYIEYMFENHNGTMMFHGRTMKKGSQTVLGNAANDMELFLTNECSDFELADVKEQVCVDIRLIAWGHKHRSEYENRYKVDKAKADERKKKGLPMEYFCKSLYWPQRGAFFVLPFNTMGLGTGTCHSCKLKESNNQELTVDFAKSTFVYKKVKYCLHDFVYVRPEHFGEVVMDNERFKAGRNVGLKAYVVCQVLGIETSSKKPTLENMKLKVRRFYRPEDISSEKAYRSDVRELYYSEDMSSVPLGMLEGKCDVRKKSQIPDSELPISNHIFFCEHSYDPVKGSFKQLPANFKIQSSADIQANGSISRKNKGKCKEGEKDDFIKWKNIPPENRLATLDIFAGCGGLSEGLQQSGVSYTKWAIEYEQPAGEAFSQNHPDAVMFIDNCNVILRAIMEKCGDADDCVSTAEATELAAALDEEKVKNLPVPGQVDFINGGPPCQGFSGMNRFSHGMWSKVQCEMILAFLSYADYFRPRFFLLENVRTFVSFNKGQTFRLAVASLLEMGYQVRFGILEAGAYGVSQSRKRAFIWAASPEETLPEWPEPMHVFASPELKVSLPGDIQYAAVRSTAAGAPFRSITVRDTIGDLPSVVNGASKTEIEYGVEPVSWFQKQIRGNTMVLSDHISKEMNELNLIRCQHIPKQPGSDWRDLPEKKVKLSTGQMVDLIPWCLPNTAKRHNQWKGLFGRLDWEGNFPTSITDPQPMGKVGMCFHPEQDRILTVRECARSQGFPDSYRFSGNIQNKHRQIGNAVPPQLAYALGRKLKEVIDTKDHTSLKSK